MTEGVLQPGAAAFDLELAGIGARATMRRLPVARGAGASFEPQHWDAVADAVSAVLALHLATKHALRVVRHFRRDETERQMGRTGRHGPGFSPTLL